VTGIIGITALDPKRWILRLKLEVLTRYQSAKHLKKTVLRFSPSTQAFAVRAAVFTSIDQARLLMLPFAASRFSQVSQPE
jgi:hypothetical protein